MSETGQADDFSGIVKKLYRCALNPDEWTDLIDAMRGIELGNDGDRASSQLMDHFELAAELARSEVHAPDETFADLRFTSGLKLLRMSDTAAHEFAPVFTEISLGETLSAIKPHVAAQIVDGISRLKLGATSKFPIVISRGPKVSCSYLVQHPGETEVYNLYLLRNGFAEEYDLSTSLLHSLTLKEREVCGYVFEGLSLQQISDRTSNTPNTIKSHLKSIFAKTGVNKQADLTRVLEQAYLLERELKQQIQNPGRLVIDQDRADTLNDIAHPEKQFLLLPNDRRIAWRDYGSTDGHPILWVHGAYACGRLWDDAIDVADRYGLRFIAIDRAGYGATSPLRKPSIEGVTADTAAVMDHLKLSNADVLAAGSGSLFALHLALREPERIERVFLGSASFGPNRDVSNPKNRVQFAFSLAHRNPKLMHALLKLFVRPRTKAGQMAQIRKMWSESKADSEALLDDHMVEYMVAVGEEALGEGIDGLTGDNIALRAADVPLHLVNQPVVEWHGQDDVFFSWEASNELLKPIPNLERIKVPGRGQLLFHTDFEQIAERISNSR